MQIAIQPKLVQSELDIRTDTRPPAVIFWGLQPAVLVFTYFASSGLMGPLGPLTGLLLVFAGLSIVEGLWPARVDWKQTGADRLGCLAMFALSFLAMAVWQFRIYPALLDRPFEAIRSAFVSLWPSTAPMPLQIVMAFLLIQFFAYWLHRFQHRIPFFWRLTGHGVHHTYTRLNAIVSAACAHMNVRVNIRGIGLFFTTNVHHVHHHSSDFRESNTNYGCASTLWDRVFGTFEHADTGRLGDFAEEPNLVQKLVLPVTGKPF